MDNYFDVKDETDGTLVVDNTTRPHINGEFDSADVPLTIQTASSICIDPIHEQIKAKLKEYDWIKGVYVELSSSYYYAHNIDLYTLIRVFRNATTTDSFEFYRGLKTILSKYSVEISNIIKDYISNELSTCIRQKDLIPGLFENLAPRFNTIIDKYMGIYKDIVGSIDSNMEKNGTDLKKYITELTTITKYTKNEISTEVYMGLCEKCSDTFKQCISDLEHKYKSIGIDIPT